MQLFDGVDEFSTAFSFFLTTVGKKIIPNFSFENDFASNKGRSGFFCFSQLLTEFFFLVKASFYWRGPKICADVWQPWWPPKFQEFWGWPEKRNGDGKPLFWVIKYFERSNILTLTPFWKWALQKLVHILAERGNRSKLKFLLCRPCICIREHNVKKRWQKNVLSDRDPSDRHWYLKHQLHLSFLFNTSLVPDWHNVRNLNLFSCSSNNKTLILVLLCRHQN